MFFGTHFLSVHRGCALGFAQYSCPGTQPHPWLGFRFLVGSLDGPQGRPEPCLTLETPRIGRGHLTQPRAPALRMPQHMGVQVERGAADLELL